MNFSINHIIMRAKPISLLFIFLFILTGAGAQSFKAGTAKRVITPGKLIPISGGMGEPVIPDGHVGDLFVRAFVLEKNNIRVAIISVEKVGRPAKLGDMSR
jgi:hypothetical protein